MSDMRPTLEDEANAAWAEVWKARDEVKRLREENAELRADRDRWRHEHRIASQREREWKVRARAAEED